MNILVITEHCSPVIQNGSDHFCYELIAELKTMHTIDILARKTKESEGVKYAIDEATYQTPESLLCFLESIPFESYDLVYNLGALSFGCCIIQYIQEAITSIPLMNHFQLLYAPYVEKRGLPESQSGLFGDNQLEVMKLATINIFVSQQELMSALDYGAPLKRGKVAVIPNGIRIPSETETKSIQPPTSAVVFLLAGRLNDPVKGADMAFRAFRRLLADGEHAFLHVVGDTHELNDLLDGIPRDGYQLDPWMSREKWIRTIHLADVLLVPSRYEPFGLVAIEAMEKGIPVIANNVGGLSEIIHHEKNGLLNPEVNGSLGLYQAMKHLIHHPEERKKMGENARKTVIDQYAITRIAQLVDAQIQQTRLTFDLFGHYATNTSNGSAFTA